MVGARCRMASTTSRPLTSGRLKVGEHEIPAALVKARESTSAVSRGLADIPERLNEVADDRPDARLVVDHEHPGQKRLGRRNRRNQCKRVVSMALDTSAGEGHRAYGGDRLQNRRPRPPGEGPSGRLASGARPLVIR